MTHCGDSGFSPSSISSYDWGRFVSPLRPALKLIMFMDAVAALITEAYAVVLVAEHNAVTEPSLPLAVAKKEHMYDYMGKLFVAALLTGCVSAVSQPNPVPVAKQTTSSTSSVPSVTPNDADKVFNWPMILNGQIQGSFNIDGTLKNHRVVCKKSGGVWDYDDNRCGFHSVDVSFGTEVYVLHKGNVGPVTYIEVGEGNKITFVYSSISSVHRNKWLEYLYERYGEPFDHYQNNDETYSSRKWEFDNGIVYISDHKITPTAPDVNRHRLVGPQLDTPASNYVVVISYVKGIEKNECKIGIPESQYTKPLFIYIDGVVVGIRLPINATVSCGLHKVSFKKFYSEGGETKDVLVDTTHFAPAIVTAGFER